MRQRWWRTALHTGPLPGRERAVTCRSARRSWTPTGPDLPGGPRHSEVADELGRIRPRAAGTAGGQYALDREPEWRPAPNESSAPCGRSWNPTYSADTRWR